MTEDQSPDDPLVEVRATVNLTGLRAGQTARVDPAQPYIAALLEKQRLVKVTDE